MLEKFGGMQRPARKFVAPYAVVRFRPCFFAPFLGAAFGGTFTRATFRTACSNRAHVSGSGSGIAGKGVDGFLVINGVYHAC